MELEVKLNRWKYLLEQMQGCKKVLLKNENRLEEHLREVKKYEANQEIEIIRKKLEKHKEVLIQQEKCVGKLVLVLERAGEYYAGCEEHVIEAGEEKRKRFSEEIKRVELKEWKVMPVLLKR